MEYRNPKKTAGVAIDCEINHPVFGWIPFTADPADTGAAFDVASLYAELAADPNTLEYVAPPPVVPQSVTPRQVRLLLLSQGLLSQVTALIEQQDEATQIAWEYASEFRRDEPLLLSLATTLGLTNQQLDDFFIAAAVI
jgi:hypothetical protein